MCSHYINKKVLKKKDCGEKHLYGNSYKCSEAEICAQTVSLTWRWLPPDEQVTSGEVAEMVENTKPMELLTNACANSLVLISFLFYLQCNTFHFILFKMLPFMFIIKETNAYCRHNIK